MTEQNARERALRPYDDPKILAAILDLIFEVGEAVDVESGQPRADYMATARYNAHEDEGEITVPLRWFERVIKSHRVLQIRRQDWMADREREMSK